MKSRELLKKLDVGEADETQLLLAEDTGLETDILNTVMTGFGSLTNVAEGEYYFLGEERPEAFTCRITVVPDVKPENEALLCLELAGEDYDIPAGCFAYDEEEKAVVYYLSVPLPEGLTEKEIIKEADLVIRLSLRLSMTYAAGYEAIAKREII